MQFESEDRFKLCYRILLRRLSDSHCSALIDSHCSAVIDSHCSALIDSHCSAVIDSHCYDDSVTHTRHGRINDVIVLIALP